MNWEAPMTAIGTVGTAVVAAGVLVRDQRDRIRQRRQAERGQASQISAWAYDDDSTRETVFEVSNQSNLPAFDFVILTPNSSITEMANFNMGSLSPRQTFSDRLPWPATLVHSLDRRRPAPVAFIDANGKRWLRDGLGLLHDGTQANLDAVEYTNGIVGHGRRQGH